MKSSQKKLAIFGGPPAFGEKLHVGRPNIGDRDRLMGRIGEILDSQWFTNDGPVVREFERRIAEFVNVKHCIATCNATTGLEIAVRAAGLTGEVIVPSLTFIATAHALEWTGLTPVFCDVEPATHNIDPARAEALITDRTTAILGVHLWGRPCDTDTLEDIARRHGLKLMFDAAHAFGCSHKGRMVGSFGDAEVFSFHATKFFNTFEGGAVVTDDDELAEKIRRMKNFGFVEYDEVAEAGTNGKMNEICAAQGLTSLESLDSFISTNLGNYELYEEELQSVPGIKPILYDEDESNNYQYLVLEVDEAEAGIGQDDLIRVLWAENVLARRYFYPGCHRMEPYRSRRLQVELPITENLTEKLVTLPTGTAVGPKEVSGICKIIHDAVRCGAEIRQRLAG